MFRRTLRFKFLSSLAIILALLTWATLLVVRQRGRSRAHPRLGQVGVHRARGVLRQGPQEAGTRRRVVTIPALLSAFA